ncbi:restriction endonuclease subunit S [Acinetobacter seifertii]|uniref:restriction endonuclease subunit S n=1 Tax=Acinetobacter seifertii TaxID=1530123 RepID=UPI00168BADBB|nr:restriction endonuclease subunit S [Acinetobacter seifertii]QNX11264.1 restriction endonuclease subunit S [Acinetobacter seifertii]QNX20838.1 restriction endonuclease subunit S [Acinetobacter seifertii]QNX38455.1 restriction endonuclease subunit S [Acinetobacter seifertii]QNX97974.1 restriction endonuclease subunit S [Acinetobacter seifertii]QNY01688.1 restriction endonuclease subunit S [Acinetobacter seifertii]
MNQAVHDLLEQHFDSAFATPDGITKLRELILNLAMQGKLVEQEPNDSSASELLKEIEVEKQHLLKVGRIKKPKSLLEVDHAQVPYIVPKNWIWTRLGNIGIIFNGNSINANEKESKYTGVDGLAYIATKDVGYGLDALNYKNGIYIPKSEKKFKVAPQGAVLICAEGGSAGKKCGITEQDICFGNKLFANEPLGGIPSKFILYLYLSPIFRRLFSESMTGIIGGVSIAKFLELPIPIPPLKEQCRIVSCIDNLMMRCNELEKLCIEREEKRIFLHKIAINQLFEGAGNVGLSFLQDHFADLYTDRKNVTELRKVILKLAITGHLSDSQDSDSSVDSLLEKVHEERIQLKLKVSHENRELAKAIGFEIPKHWRWTSLGQIIVFGPKNGFSPKAVDYETSVRSLTLSATTSGVFIGEHSKFIDEDIPSDSHLWLNDGDILVQRGNTIEYVGVPAIYKGEPRVFIYPDLMMKLRVSPHINTEYIYYVMSSEPSRNFLRSRASGTSGTMPKINQKALTGLPIPLPPIEEQLRIVNNIKRLLQLCYAVEEKIETLNSKQSELLGSIVAQV